VNSINLQTASDAELEQQIINFRSTMLDSRKSATEGEMNFGDAVFLMEAAFNYQYGYITLTYSQSKTDTISIPIDIDETGQIKINELQNLFKSINNSIYDLYQANIYPNKHIKYIDLTLDSLFLSAIVAIGDQDTKKGAWLRAKPFNSQQGATWKTCSYNVGYFGPTCVKYDIYSEVSIALNNVIDLPLEGSNAYIYNIQSTGWVDNITSFNWADFYVSDIDITSPNEESSLFYFFSGYWQPDIEEWNYGVNGSVPTVNYKQMNKYYNVSMLCVEKLRPHDNREPINAKFVSVIMETWDWAGRYRWLDGAINITYASKSKYLIAENALMPMKPIVL
jgi:hypothetical protein